MSKMIIDGREIETSEVLEILIDHFPDIIHSVDNDGNIVYTNKRASALLGYSKEELLRMNIRQLYPDEIMAEVEKGFQNLKEKGGKNVESIVKDRNGTRIPVEIRSFSIYDDDGCFLRTFSILRDIRPIKELQASLVHAGRLAAIGELAAGIMHDVANPLTVIIMANSILVRTFSDMTKRAALPPDVLEDATGYTTDIERACKSIEKLVEHLRHFARSQVEQLERVDLHAVIEDAVFIAKNKIDKAGIKVELTVPAALHYVMGSPNRLEQVFVNLISNASDAMDGCPRRLLTFAVAACEFEGRRCWRCDVADTGAGIPKEIQDDIFRSFFTTKPKGKGTGLGLSISRGVAKEHKGDLQVCSTPGEGTTFSLFLPVADPVAKPPAPS